MSKVILNSTRCAICGTEGNASEVYPANFDFGDFTPEVFSARRLPDRIHYRIVKCDTCGLVRSDPVADVEVLGDLYRQSTFDYGSEVANLRRTYGRYLDRLSRLGVNKESLLEIGCGNGFFLEEALTRGFKRVMGVEPSIEAIDKASSRVRDGIVCEMMRPGLFPEEHFDAVCLFQVLDHLPEPAAVLAEVSRILRPGGMVLILNHNVEAVSARLLGERSPIIDLEHTYLYSPATLSRLCGQNGLLAREGGMAANSYSLEYVLRLLPLPKEIKHAILKLLSGNVVGRLSLLVPLGNMYIIAERSQ